MQYRREIDGFRALCIIPVIFYHANIPLFAGGFIGVDIFFVISGYLITLLILNEIKNNTFSIKSFYERRVRRILPALFLILICCLPFSVLYLSPHLLLDFSKNLLATLSFTSNFYINSESGYFENFSEMKPLLHTWSLAIEEQYYLIFPFFMVVFWKFKKMRFYGIVILIVIFLLSFLYANLITSMSPGSTFYLTLARIWEILLGSFCAFVIFYHERFFLNNYVNNLISGIGITLLIYALYFFNDSTYHPGLFTLIPTIGAVLIILFADSKTLIGKLLSQNMLVAIGLISYSAYLWHQPIFAFSRVIFDMQYNELALVTASGLILLTFSLSWFSWKFIEQPFREKNINNNYKLSINFLYIPFFILLFAGLVGIFSNGLNFRFTQQISNLDKYHQYEWQDHYRQYECFLETENTFDDFNERCLLKNNDSILLWGDSIAGSIYPGMSKIYNISQFTTSGCPPLLFNKNYKIKSELINQRPNCSDINIKISNLITNNSFKAIILHAVWDQYNMIDVKTGLETTLENIRKNNPEIQIIVIGTPLSWVRNDGAIGLLKQQTGESDELVIIETYLGSLKKFDLEINEIVNENDSVHFLSIANLMCSKEINIKGNNHCIGGFLVDGDIIPYSWDWYHHTVEGSTHIAEKIKTQLDKIIENRHD